MSLLRIYSPEECGEDGYPYAWHQETAAADQSNRYLGDGPLLEFPIKDLIRERAGHRCQRCGHPYPPGIAEAHPRGEWTPCDERCSHDGPVKLIEQRGNGPYEILFEFWDRKQFEGPSTAEWVLLAQWRILTVHHLNGEKADCRWWNLVALCQKCHLSIQGRVVMERAFILEHSDWFKPYAAGWYAAKYLEEDWSREDVLENMDGLLDLERLA